MTCRRAICETYQVGIAEESPNGSSKCSTRLSTTLERIGPDDELVVIGGEVLRQPPGRVELVKGRLVEANREGLDRPRRRPRHQPDDEARVHASGEERADRHVAHQVRLHGVGENRREALRGLVHRAGERFLGGKFPVAADRQLSIPPPQDRWPGGSFRMPREDRRVGGV